MFISGRCDMETKKILHLLLALIFIIATVLAAGCAQKSARTTTQADQTNWEWVPRVWVDNSFTGGQYSNCSYDMKSEGYWCPPGTK